MASPVEALLLLCDAAQADAATGKVHMLGAGWSTTGSPTAPQAVVAMLKIPWDRANERLTLTLALLDSDGQQVVLGDPPNRQPVATQVQVEVGRPPGLAHGSPLDYSFAVSLPPMPLPSGRYEWRLEIAERQVTAAFQVVAAPI
jgi:hypothetical protein